MTRFASRVSSQSPARAAPVAGVGAAAPNSTASLSVGTSHRRQCSGPRRNSTPALANGSAPCAAGGQLQTESAHRIQRQRPRHALCQPAGRTCLPLEVSIADEQAGDTHPVQHTCVQAAIRGVAASVCRQLDPGLRRIDGPPDLVRQVACVLLLRAGFDGARSASGSKPRIVSGFKRACPRRRRPPWRSELPRSGRHHDRVGAKAMPVVLENQVVIAHDQNADHCAAAGSCSARSSAAASILSSAGNCARQSPASPPATTTCGRSVCVHPSASRMNADPATMEHPRFMRADLSAVTRAAARELQFVGRPHRPFIQMMRRHDDGRPVRDRALDQRAQGRARARIEAGIGLIEQQDIRLIDQCTREQHATKLTVRECFSPCEPRALRLPRAAMRGAARACSLASSSAVESDAGVNARGHQIQNRADGADRLPAARVQSGDVSLKLCSGTPARCPDARWSHCCHARSP